MNSGRPFLLLLTVSILLAAGAGASASENTKKASEKKEIADSTVSFEDLFRRPIVQEIELSPTAEYVVYQKGHEVFAGNGDVGYVRTHKFFEDEYIREIRWIGDDTLVVLTFDSARGRVRLHPSRIGFDDNGEFAELEYENHTINGYIDDVLLDDPDSMIVARYRDEEDYTAADLFRIDVFVKSDQLFRNRNAIRTGSDEFIGYLKDASGEYVVAHRYRDGIPEIWQREPGTKDWVQRWVGTKESKIEPEQLSADGRSLYALSNAFTDKVAAIELDLDAGALSRVIYEHERFDLKHILFDADEPDPYGVIYSEQGLLRYFFFTDDSRAEFERLQSKFPDKGVTIIGRSRDDSVLLVRTSTSRDRGQIQHCDMKLDECDTFITLSPWLENKILSDTVVLEAEVDENLTVEVFLTLPVAASDSVPLIVMPHGGPIGVSDSRYFSPDVQWLAQNGYAVLQVNYRGSSGYGRAFRDAGLRQWGRGIEDDIDAAVMAALETYPQLDRSRVGIYGASYGGYSALMSVIRNPELYRCGASFAGVTDLTLLFAQSRLHRNPALREQLVRIVGDPELDYDEQREHSPAYRYRDIERPVFLAHGSADRIVDIEHSWRLFVLMRLRGIEPDFITMDDVGHGFEYVSEAKDLYEPLLEFLNKHLGIDPT